MKDKSAILITTYNGGEYICSLLDKIRLSLKYARYHHPVYIYDDSSKDNTVAQIKEYVSRHLDLEVFLTVNTINLGLFPNKNFALNQLMEKFDWVFIMHQDDYPNVNWISGIHKVIDSYEMDSVFAIWSNYFDDAKTDEKENLENIIVERIRPSPENLEFWVTEIYTPFSISGCAINMRLFQNNTNIFDENFSHFGDTCFIVDNMALGLDHLFISNNLITRRTSLGQASNIHFQNSADIKEFLIFYQSRSHVIKGKGLLIRKLIILTVKRICIFIIRGNFKMVYINAIHFVSLTAVYLRNLIKFQ